MLTLKRESKLESVGVDNSTSTAELQRRLALGLNNLNQLETFCDVLAEEIEERKNGTRRPT